jgi:hypothetical protein
MYKGGNMKTKPLNNNVLIEVIREDDGVSRTDENESMKQGRVIDASISMYHLTASAAVELDQNFIANSMINLKGLIGKTVRWEEYAEGGQTFEEDGKTFALVPWWRLISFEEGNE